jgi:hypothetical protein
VAGTRGDFERGIEDDPRQHAKSLLELKLLKFDPVLFGVPWFSPE